MCLDTRLFPLSFSLSISVSYGTLLWQWLHSVLIGWVTDTSTLWFVLRHYIILGFYGESYKLIIIHIALPVYQKGKTPSVFSFAFIIIFHHGI